jgi:hypothetical protein
MLLSRNSPEYKEGKADVEKAIDKRVKPLEKRVTALEKLAQDLLQAKKD